MKKLILGAAFLLAFAGTAIAQTDNKTQSTTTTTAPAATPAPTSGITVGGTPASVGGTPATVGTPAATTTTTAPATTTTATAATAQQEPATATDGKEYNKVTQNQIAAAVLKKAVAKYKDYALVEALAAADGSDYKLVLTKDGKDIAAYYKPNGDFIKEETV